MGENSFSAPMEVSSYPKAQDLIILIIIFWAVNAVNGHESMNEIAWR